MSRPSSSRSSRGLQQQQRHSSESSRARSLTCSARDMIVGRCESFPFDEYSTREANNSDDSSSVVVLPRSNKANNEQRYRQELGRGFLDAFSCLCIGSNDANDHIDENELYDYVVGSPSKKTTKASPSAESPREVTKLKLVQPVAFVADQEGAFLEHRRPLHGRSSSFPASRFVFRPVSDIDDETTVTGFTSNAGWEI